MKKEVDEMAFAARVYAILPTRGRVYALISITAAV